MRLSAARAYLFLGAASIALHFVLHQDVTVYDAVGLTAACSIFVATAYYRPRIWRAWLVIGVSQVFMSTGDLIYDNVTKRYPGPADAFYLPAVVLFVVGLLMLTGSAPRGVALANVDALLVTLGFGIVSWVLVFDGIGSTTSLLDRAVAYAYPVADLVTLGVVARLMLVGGRRRPAFWLLVGSVLALFLADAVWVVPALNGSYDGGTSWLDLGWLGSYVLLGAAALHPSMTEPVGEQQEQGPVGMTRVLVIGAAITFAPFSVVVANILGRPVNLVAIAAAGTALIALVVARFALIVRDLGRLHREAVASERKFRMVFERSPIGISVGRNGIMSETNPALQQMLGYAPEEFARTHFLDVTYEEDRSLEPQLELDASKRDRFSVDKRYVAKDGRIVDTHVHVALDLDDGLGISLIEDVTQRRRLEEELRQAQKMEAVGKLAGGIAHDFNNLMTAILGYSDLILARLDADDANRRKLESIREASIRASDLTRQLLAFSRKQMLQTAAVDLDDVVQGMDELLRRLIGDDIRLVTKFSGEELVVLADPSQLEQAVINLAVNAREAMPAGGTLTIETAANGDEAVLTVEDTGVGIDEATVSRIFEPFFTTKPVGSGTGLGLSTVHGIVGQSGGTLEVESEPGRGTRFTVRLPLATRNAVLPAEPALATLVD